MTWYEAIARSGIGIPMRRAAWRSNPARAADTLIYLAGAGSRRAVAVIRANGTDTVVTAALVAAADLLANDWEAAT